MRLNNDYIWRGLVAAAVVGGGLLALGCQSRITGNEGELEFSYTTDDLTSDFNKPIGVGAKLEVRVQTAGEREAVSINDVISADEGVLLVDSFSGNRFILEGMDDGNALVEVLADGPDGEVSDSVNMRAATPEVLQVSHTCTSEVLGHYPVGKADVLVPFDLEMNDGTNVIGYGLYPVDLAEGLGTLETTSTDQANLRIDLGSTPGQYELSSTVDDTSLTFALIEEGQIDGASINDDSPSLRVIEDNTNFIYVWPTVGGNRVCQADADMTATSLTPEICDVRNNETPSDADSFANPEGYVAIEGLAAGQCDFEVTFPNANDGAGATETFTAQVGTFPGENNSM